MPSPPYNSTLLSVKLTVELLPMLNCSHVVQTVHRPFMGAGRALRLLPAGENRFDRVKRGDHVAGRMRATAMAKLRVVDHVRHMVID